MATSGSVDYSRNALQVITAALRKLRVVSAGDSASGADLTTGLEALNLMVKAWQNDQVFLWLNQQAVLHLAPSTGSYTLGPSGTHFCAASDAVQTTLSADAAAAATALTVDSNSGIAASDYVGVVLDDGTVDWTTQSGAPAGTTDLTLAAGLSSAASSGNVVFAYTTKLARPIAITEARLRDIDGNDNPINVTLASDSYWQHQTDKTSTGDCQEMLFAPLNTSALVYTWPTCDDATKRIFMTVQRIIEDFDASTNDADMPAEVTECLIYNLALRLSPEYRSSVPQDIATMAAYTYGQVKAKFDSREPVQLRPPTYMRHRR